MRSVVVSILLMVSFTAHTQISWERQAMHRMEKGQWARAAQALQRAMRKDTANITAQYLRARYFLNPSNPATQLDSARRYYQLATNNFRRTPSRDRDRLKRFPLDSSTLVALKQEVDSAAFERAKKTNTIEAYQHFATHFADARQQPAAIELRDEVAFLETLKKNTWTAFGHYLETYPNSHRKADAKQRYDKLLYEAQTRDRRLHSYEQFLTDHPDSPYQEAALQQVFEISTASGSAPDYTAFLQRYPESASARHAEQLLYFIVREKGEANTRQWSEYLVDLRQRNEQFWLPIFQDNKFGFMTGDGTVQITPRYAQIDSDYKCNPVTAEILLTSDGLVDRRGTVILAGHVQSVQELGAGFLSAEIDSAVRVVHKGGWQFSRPVKQARLIAGRYLALEQSNGKWELITLTGRTLLPAQYDDIQSLENIVVLTRSGKKQLYRPEVLAALADRQELPSAIVVDEAKVWHDDAILVRNGALEGVVNQQLEEVIPLDRQTLSYTSFGFLRQKNGQTYVEGIPALAGTGFDQVRIAEPWLMAVRSSGKQLILIPEKKILEHSADSLWTDGPFAGAREKDSVRLHLPSRMFALGPNENYQWRKGPDGTVIFIQAARKNKTILNADGNKLFTATWDDVQPVGYQLFLVTRGSKKGFVNLQGKAVLPADYDAIILQGDYASVFKDKKFGAFRLFDQKLIKPTFERNLVPYGSRGWIGFKDGKYGFLLPDGKPTGKFEYNEMQYYNDTLAWVKQPLGWRLQSPTDNEPLLDRVTSWEAIAEQDGAPVIAYVREHLSGVFSLRRGKVLAPTFHTVENAGLQDHPVYRCEKEVEEAGIIVVLFYDRTGQLIRRQVMEQEDYDKISCEEN